jgi:peptidoglycan/xylan/chitin deacetylase (PgdA/CDA1 family)
MDVMGSDTPGMTMDSPAQRTGLAAIGLSAFLFFFNATWAALPLAIFIFLCAVASFSPRSCFFLRVISRGHTGQKAVALTFDDGPDPLTTPLLIDVLARHGMKATFFVSGQSAQRYPEWIESMLSQGHLIGNHSYSHSPCLMLHRFKKLYLEIATAQEIFKKLGILPFAFRPPVGLTNPKLGPILSQLDMICVTFSCRAYDRGNRQLHGMAAKILKKVRSDDIILLHDVRPSKTDDIRYWLTEIESTLSGLTQRGFSVLPLDELIGKPVMTLCRKEGSSSSTYIR